ncbi:hypothetical protein MWH25_08025 [Natroniella acetigena]|uniref:hypothetical protein n=1 Tax=Natroniella acetigena TaxID=52004 RepID=UPI00200B4E0E|nr:hypothetical protein [Natroniella acetigena]MCK8827689.1 hypothetical protein [Natroniella acetigena]
MRYHYYDDNCDVLWASNGRYIFKKSIYSEFWEKVLKIKELPILSVCGLFNRVSRNGIHNIIPLNNENLVILIKRKILVYRNRKLIKAIPLTKGKRPLRKGILKLGGNLIYGEYWTNSKNSPPRICKVDPINGKIEFLVTFQNKKHIHFIQQDVLNEDNIFIGTGDSNDASGIYRYNIKSNQLDKIGSGSQDWRAVSIIQKENDIFWGSDSANEQTYILKYNRNAKELERIRPIAGPAYYSTIDNNGNMYIATTIEDRRKHKAIIYKSSNGLKWNKFKEWKKDIFPERLFGYGIIEFIKGQENLDDLFINLRGLK